MSEAAVPMVLEDDYMQTQFNPHLHLKPTLPHTTSTTTLHSTQSSKKPTTKILPNSMLNLSQLTPRRQLTPQPTEKSLNRQTVP